VQVRNPYELRRHVARVLARLLEPPNDEVVGLVELQAVKADLLSLAEQRASSILEQRAEEGRLRSGEEIADGAVVLKVAAKDAIESRQVQQSLEFVEDDDHPPVRSLGDPGRHLQQRVHRGDRVRLGATLKSEAADRSRQPEATELSTHRAAYPTGQAEIGLFEPNGEVGHAEDIAEVDVHRDQLPPLGLRGGLLEEGGLAHPTRRVQRQVVAPFESRQQRVYLRRTQDGLRGRERP
jgi:hypothetical protein